MKNQSRAEQIMTQCLLVNDYLKTIAKSLAADGHNIDEFIDHYSDLIDMIISINWRTEARMHSGCPPSPVGDNHDTAEAIERDDFRKNLKID